MFGNVGHTQDSFALAHRLIFDLELSTATHKLGFLQPLQSNYLSEVLALVGKKLTVSKKNMHFTLQAHTNLCLYHSVASIDYL